jgi:hypothetical protein
MKLLIMQFPPISLYIHTRLNDAVSAGKVRKFRTRSILKVLCRGGGTLNKATPVYSDTHTVILKTATRF